MSPDGFTRDAEAFVARRKPAQLDTALQRLNELGTILWDVQRALRLVEDAPSQITHAVLLVGDAVLCLDDAEKEISAVKEKMESQS